MEGLLILLIVTIGIVFFANIVLDVCLGILAFIFVLLEWLVDKIQILIWDIGYWFKRKKGGLK